MKTLLFTIITLISIKLTSQASISVSKSQVYEFNDLTEEFEILGELDNPSLFKINDAQTMIIHTTEGNKSTYYITDKTYNKLEQTIKYVVTSDTGNEYIFNIFFDEDRITVLWEDSGKVYLGIYFIKSIF